MNASELHFARSALLALTAFALLAAPHQSRAIEPTPALPLDVLRLESVPKGHYLVNLQAHGPERWLNFEVKGATAVCVNASDPALRGLRGSFQSIGNGVFLVSFSNESYRGTQFWVFQPDGTARVKEIPDRGEKQEARPVRDDSLTRAPASQPTPPKS